MCTLQYFYSTCLYPFPSFVTYFAQIWFVSIKVFRDRSLFMPQIGAEEK